VNSSYEISTAPTAEPVSVEYLSSWLRLNGNTENNIVATCIASARSEFEKITGHYLMPQTVKLHLQDWPSIIYIQKNPVRSITSISYRDADGVATTLATDQYDVNLKSAIVTIYPRRFPALSPYIKPRISVTFEAGYTSADSIPKFAISLIAARATDYFENRVGPENTTRFLEACRMFSLGTIGDLNDA